MSGAPLARRSSQVALTVDVSVLAALAALGIFGFAASFGGLEYLRAGLGGVGVGILAALIAARLRFGAILSAAVAAALYFLLGAPLAVPGQALFAVLPTQASITSLAQGAIFGWSDVVTLSAPVEAPDYLAVLPYVAGWIVATVSTTLAARWFVSRGRTPARSAVALIAPILLYVASVLTGTDEPFFAAVRGIAFAAISLIWVGSAQFAASGRSRMTSGRVVRTRVIGIAVIAVVAAGSGIAVGAVAAPTGDQRFVLREKIEPPFDPLRYPSPLSGFRSYTNAQAEDTLFTVTGLSPGERVRLATMDYYDGRLWSVTGPDTQVDGSGSFTVAGSTLPRSPGEGASVPATANITIDTYADYWLPSIGYPTSVKFAGSVAPASGSLRYNPATGIAIVTSGVSSGMQYSVSATEPNPDAQTAGALVNSPVAQIDLPPVSNVPNIIESKAIEFAAGAQTPFAQITAISETLRTTGFLSHGSGAGDAPSSAGHGADRMERLLTRSPIVGDAEQYASALALMARSLGYPSRVVMGFAPTVADGATTVEVKGADVTAWVEVVFEGAGWVAFSPTPDDQNVPPDQTPQPKSTPQPQVRQPPRTDTAQDEPLTTAEVQKDKKKKTDAGFVIPGWAWAVGAGVTIPLLIYFVPLLIIAAIRRRRRRLRRTSGPPDRQAAGAWDELVDSYAELGFVAPKRSTRLQSAREFEGQVRDASAKSVPVARGSVAVGQTIVRDHPAATERVPALTSLARRADEAVFAGREIPPDVIDQLWTEASAAAQAARTSVSWIRRRVSVFRLPKRKGRSR